MFGKRPSELTSEDIQRVLSEKVPEGQEVEFKEDLPAKRGKHPWTSGANELGEYVSRQLLPEVIAFANAYGGWLLVGIEETSSKPARASEIAPLRDCAELAERLRLQCRDCIEPQIPILQVEGVPTQADGSGVVVFHAPRSRMAPHRHTQTKECYIRRADRTEKMTMREIQDLTLQVERGLAAIDATFKCRQDQFAEVVGRFRGSEQVLGVRATAIPITSIFVEQVHNNEAVRPPLKDLQVTIANNRRQLQLPAGGHDWRPTLRGTRVEGEYALYTCKRELYCDGLVEYRLLALTQGDHFLIHPDWIIGLAANCMWAAELFRRAAGAPDVEYALELAIAVVGKAVSVDLYGRSQWGETLGPFPTGNTLFPRYSLGPKEEFPSVVALLERDFWHAAGFDPSHKFVVDFDRSFDKM